MIYHPRVKVFIIKTRSVFVAPDDCYSRHTSIKHSFDPLPGQLIILPLSKVANKDLIALQPRSVEMSIVQKNHFRFTFFQSSCTTIFVLSFP